jgi:hypothetical protein
MEDNTLFKCAQQHRTRDPVHGKRLALQNSRFPCHSNVKARDFVFNRYAP